jgi:adenylate cyclase
MLEPSPNSPIRNEQREVSLLFADLRGFTGLAETLQTDPLVGELLTHVMDCLSDAVASQDGFIVDYFGDGLMAIWNAPTSQTDHAARACRAALQMLASLPSVGEEWANVIHTELRVGIGVHTGIAQVGNAGSSRKVKYGPRGPNVNLASRVEAATKELGVPFVATQATVDLVTDEFAINRICRAQLPGLPQALDLYAVDLSQSDTVKHAWQTYANALQQFEQGNFEVVADILSSIEEESSNVPRRFLMDRANNELGRRLRRRNSDRPVSLPNGVIPVIAK